MGPENGDRIGLRRAEDYFRFVEDLVGLARHYRTFSRPARASTRRTGSRACTTTRRTV
jgi:hypothetical protein